MKKFLIIQTAFIGDVILATSLIEKIYKYNLAAQIDFLLRKGNENLFARHPFINEVLVWNKRKNKHKNLSKLIRQIRKTKYDYVINCQRFTSSGILTALSGAKNKIGFNKNPFSVAFTKKIPHTIGDNRHEIDRNHDLIAHLTDAKPEMPKLYPAEKDYQKTKKLRTSRYICIAPTSVWFTKQFPAHKWTEFISTLDEKYKIFLLGAKGDFLACQEIIRQSKRENIQNLAGKLNLLESAALMKNACMNYTNDSAPLHLASAMNANVTAVFCSTVPQFGFGPLSENSKIVETKQNMKCRPCGLHGFRRCPEKHFNCANSIDIAGLAF